MVRINRLTGSNDATLYAKLEWYNVGGSVKDRMALYLIEYAEAAGKLKRDKKNTRGNFRKHRNRPRHDCCSERLQNHHHNA